MRTSDYNTTSRARLVMVQLKEIKAQLYELNRKMRYENQVTEAWHAYAEAHRLQGKQYRIEYNKWMQAHHLEHLMLSQSDL